MKSQATVQLSDGTICEAEIHWYQSHGIGKKEFKFKTPVRVRQARHFGYFAVEAFRNRVAASARVFRTICGLRS
jgi:hypothetical protein